MCNATYVGETAHRLDQLIKEHGGKDNNSCIFRHSVDAGHACYGGQLVLTLKLLLQEINIHTPKR